MRDWGMACGERLATGFLEADRADTVLALSPLVGRLFVVVAAAALVMALATVSVAGAAAAIRG